MTKCQASRSGLSGAIRYLPVDVVTYISIIIEVNAVLSNNHCSIITAGWLFSHSILRRMKELCWTYDHDVVYVSASVDYTIVFTTKQYTCIAITLFVTVTFCVTINACTSQF